VNIYTENTEDCQDGFTGTNKQISHMNIYTENIEDCQAGFAGTNK
jgi:hypothetical protein